MCGLVELVNENFMDEAALAQVEDRLMPRTEELPIYTTEEFNNKVNALSSKYDALFGYFESVSVLKLL